MTVRGKHLIAPAAVLVGAWWLLDRLIVTDREAIEGIVGDMCRSAGAADVEGIFARISPNFENDTISRDDLRLLATAFFARYGPVSVRVRRDEINIAGSRAAAVVSVVGIADKEGYAGFFGDSQWELDLRRGSDGKWLVTNLSPMKIGGADVNGWGDVRRHAGLQ